MNKNDVIKVGHVCSLKHFTEIWYTITKVKKLAYPVMQKYMITLYITVIGNVLCIGSV